MDKHRTCRTCAAFNDLHNSNERGECRRHAPSLDSGDHDWPMVKRFAWCLEYVPLEKGEARNA